MYAVGALADQRVPVRPSFVGVGCFCPVMRLRFGPTRVQPAVTQPEAPTLFSDTKQRLEIETGWTHSPATVSTIAVHCAKSMPDEKDM